MTGPKRDLTTIAVTPTVRAAVHRAGLTWSSEIGQRLPLSVVVQAAIQVAEQHRDEVTAVLRGLIAS